MRYLSVCSGIEAASVAWEPLGWEPVGFSEIEPFPSAVLAHRYPQVRNYGDMTEHATWDIEPGSVDVLVGGTPCQSFSVAGLRRGLHDPRGGLMLTYLEIAKRLRPRWIVWENVPGVLSSGRGRDLGAFLGALGDLGYGWAYRVLDAQWCRVDGYEQAVPQRRRRVFVVGCLGDATRAAAVLFERESVRRDPAARGAARKGAAADAAGCSGAVTAKWAKGKGPAGDEAYNLTVVQPVVYARETASSLTSSGRGVARPGESRGQDDLVVQPVACINMQGSKSNACATEDGSSYSIMAMHGHDVHAIVQPVAYRKSKRAQSATDDESSVAAETANTINAWDVGERDTHAVAFHPTQDPIVSTDGSTHCMGTGNRQGLATIAVAHAAVVAPTVTATNDPSRSPQSAEVTQQVAAVVEASAVVRRLTPRECERLQGFPDDWTRIAWRGRPAEECPDGPRYRAIGNSMAVNCMRWIGRRIAAAT